MKITIWLTILLVIIFTASVSGAAAKDLFSDLASLDWKKTISILASGDNDMVNNGSSTVVSIVNVSADTGGNKTSESAVKSGEYNIKVNIKNEVNGSIQKPANINIDSAKLPASSQMVIKTENSGTETQVIANKTGASVKINSQIYPVDKNEERTSTQADLNQMDNFNESINPVFGLANFASNFFNSIFKFIFRF